MIIAGAGGHALEINDLLVRQSIQEDLFFFSEIPELDSGKISQDRIIHSPEFLSKILKSNPHFCLGIGTPSVREKFFRFLEGLGGKFVPIIDTTSQISTTSRGNYDAMAFTFVGPFVEIGKSALLNTRVSIHHECQVGEFTEIGPGAILLGNVTVGKKCRIGAGAIILPGVSIGDEVVVGAGAVVTKNVDPLQVVAGVPAKRLNKN